MKRVAVIGGGVSGLCAARKLVGDGRVDVQLFEGGDRLGGVIRSSTEHGYLFEWAANAFLPAPDGAVALAAELDVPMEPAAAAAKKRWVFVDGAPRQVPTNPMDAIRTDILSVAGKLRLLAEPFQRRTHSDDETVAEFARRRLGAEAERKLVSPFVTGVFAGDSELLSLRAAFPMLAELDARGGLVRGMVGKLRDARQQRKANAGGPKRQRPRLTAPVAGAQALIDAVAAQIGDRAHTSARVDRLERAGDQVIVGVDGRDDERFDAVVLATPAAVSARLLAPSDAALADTLTQIPYVSVAITHVGFDRRQISHPLDGFGVIVAKGEPGVRVLGVVLESVLWANRAPQDSVLVRCIYGGQRDPGAIDESDDTLLGHARDDLRILLGIDCEPTHHHVARQRNAIAQYTVGHSERVADAERRAEPLGVVLAGSAYHGVSVNKCVADADRVASRVYQLLNLAVLCLLVLVAACSGKSQDKPEQRAKPSPTVIDAAKPSAKDAATTVAPTTYQSVTMTASNSGTLKVTVDWLDAPAKLRASPGRTRCKTPRRPPVTVHTNGGVRDIVVSVVGVARGKKLAAAGTTELAMRNCELSPPVVKLDRVGATLSIVNDDDRRHSLVVERLGGDKLADIPLPVAGRRYELVAKKPGILRVRDTADEHNVAYVIVPAHPYVAVSGDTGQVELGQVPAGSYKLEAWQRPLAARLPPKKLVASIDVVAGGTKTLQLSLAK